MKKFLLASGVLLVCFVAYEYLTLPDVSPLRKENPQITALMRQREQEAQAAGKKARRYQLWTGYAATSAKLRSAVLIGEDDAFYQHEGYDLDQIKESFARNWEKRLRFVPTQTKGSRPKGGLVRKFRPEVVPDDVLDTNNEASVDTLVREICRLDCMVTISTTTAHLAGAMGINVILIAAERKGHQWFWQVQAEHQRPFYPTVKVLLGEGETGKWWEHCLAPADALLEALRS